jgi:hypothetical protein
MPAPNPGDVPIYIGPEWGTTPSTSIGGVSTSSLNRFEYWGGQTDGATTLLGFMNCDLGNGGSHSYAGPTTGSLLLSTKRATFLAASGGGGNTCGVFDGTGYKTVWRGNAAGLGDFSLRLRFAFESAGSGATHHMLAGLIAQSGTSASQDWTTQLNIASIGVGFSQTPAPGFTGNWKLIHSVGDGATAPTVTDLGGTMPVNMTDLMQLDLVATPDAADVAYTLTDLSTGAVVSGTVTTNMPSSTTFLAMWCANAVGGGSTANSQFDVIEYCYQQNT